MNPYLNCFFPAFSRIPLGLCGSAHSNAQGFVGCRRGIKAELRTILENLMPDLKLPGPHAKNEKVEAVLAGIRGEER